MWLAIVWLYAHTRDCRITSKQTPIAGCVFVLGPENKGTLIRTD